MGVEIISNNHGDTYFWHIVSEGNNKILAHSEEYTTIDAAEEGIEAARYALLAGGPPKVFANGKGVN